ncbi:MAG: hypothetical protein H8E24_16220 [Verrucomicrobia bacterium]|nr:hypothetical protein [Verrucomicrobiota bacterium]
MKLRFAYLGVLLGLCPEHVLLGESPIPMAEEYLSGGRITAYQKDARAYLEQNPKAPLSPRLAHDLFMVATITGNEQVAKEARRALLFDYPSSLQTNYLLSSLSSDEKKLREILIEEADRVLQSEPGFPARFCRCILLALRTHGAKLLADNSLRLRVLLLAEAAGVTNLRQAAIEPLQELAEENGEQAEVVTAVLSTKSILEKLAAVHHLNGSDALFTESFYLSSLDKEQRKNPQVTELLAERAIFGRDKDFQAGIAHLENLPPKMQSIPRLSFWRAIALIGIERGDEAKKVLAKTSGVDPWSQAARSLEDGLQHSEDRRNALSKAILAAVKTFSKDVEAIRIEANLQPEEGEEQQDDIAKLYLGISTSLNLFELQVRRGDALVLAYRTDAHSSAIYSNDRKSILQFASPGAVPMPRLGLKRDAEDGTFNFNLSAGMGTTVEQVADQGERILDNPYLATSAGLETLLRYTLTQKGAWLPPASSAKGITKHIIRLAYSDDPKEKFISIGVSSDGKLRTIGFGKWNLHSIRYGSNSLLANSPAWPDLPVEKREEFDFTSFMGLIASFMDSFTK